MDITTFRQKFSEFADVTTYPDDDIDDHLSLAALQLDAGVWGDFRDRGIGLMVAHNLVLDQMNRTASSVGGSPGKVTGPQTSKSVDKVGASYDTGATTYEGAAFWNMTSYGIRLYQLMRVVGAGGRQL